MRDVRRGVLLFAAGIAVAAVLAGAGCTQPQAAKMQPKVKPPAVKEAGKLSVGVDLNYPPFGGTDNGRQAGIDIDVASALAARLGLTLSVVDVEASQAATALADGSADVVLSVPFSAEALTNVVLAGSYASDAPAFFVATEDTSPVEATMTIAALPAYPDKVGVQRNSEAYWRLVRELGEEAVQPFETFRDALGALDAGEVKVVAGDALVGAYIGRDFPTVHYAGQMQAATLLGAAVAPDNAALSDATRAALDAMAADGVLDAIRTKWVGELPKLAGESSEEASATEDASGAAGAATNP